MRYLAIISTALMIASCNDFPEGGYKLKQGYWYIDSITDKYGPTWCINQDAVIFNNGIMTTFNKADTTNIRTSSYLVVADELIIGTYQNFKILQCDSNRFIYKYHKPIQTGSNIWEFTYYLSR